MVWSLCPRPVSARTIVVDDDSNDCHAADFSTIGAAVEAASPHDEIIICAGDYAEQVVIRKALHLVGKRVGTRAAAIKPVLLPETVPSGVSGNPVTAGILIDTASPVFIQSLELDMSGIQLAGCSPILTGIFFRDASGGVLGTHVSGTRVPGHPECDGGVALYVESGPEAPGARPPVAKVKTSDNKYDGYQKAAVVGNGAGAFVRVERSEAIGSGLTGDTVQNGYQLAFGASGRFRNAVASGHASSMAGTVASGVLVSEAGRVKMRSVTVSDGQVGIYVIGSKLRLSRNTITNMSSDGLIVVGDQNRVIANDIDGSSVSGAFIDGTRNFVAGGSIANTPVGVWLFADGNFLGRRIDFGGVAEAVRIGGTRTVPAPAPFAAE